MRLARSHGGVGADNDRETQTDGSMGALHYASTRQVVPVDDVALSHLKALIEEERERDEGFVLEVEPDAGPPVALWLHPSMAMGYEFEHDELGELDPVWLDQLRHAAEGDGTVNLGARREAV